MTCCQNALLQFFQNFIGKRQQSQGVCHCTAGFSYPLCCLFLGQTVFLDQCLISKGFFHHIQILPLEIFNQRQFHGFAVVCFDDHYRDIRKACHPGCPPAAFACNDLIIPAGHFPHRQGLDHTVNGNGICQSLQLFLIKFPSRLFRIGFHLINRQFPVGTLFHWFF